MTAKALIEELNKFDLNSEVKLMYCDECDLKVCDISYGNKNRILICEKVKLNTIKDEEDEYIF